MLSAKEALNIVQNAKPECKAIECLEFKDFYAFFMVPKTYNEQDVAGAYDTVNKNTGLLATFHPTENLDLYMSAKVIELE